MAMSDDINAQSVRDYLLVFKDPLIQAKYTKYRSSDESFASYLYFPLIVTYTLITFYVFFPVLLNSGHLDNDVVGGKRFALTRVSVASVCVFFNALGLVAALFRLKYVARNLQRIYGKTFMLFRSRIEDLLLVLTPFPFGMILVVKSFRGQCPDHVSFSDSAWCNTMAAASHVMQLDIAILMMIAIGVHQYIFRGSVWSIVVIMYAIGFFFIMTAIRVTPPPHAVAQYSIVSSYFGYFYMIYRQEVQILSKFLDVTAYGNTHNRPDNVPFISELIPVARDNADFNDIFGRMDCNISTENERLNHLIFGNNNDDDLDESIASDIPSLVELGEVSEISSLSTGS